MVEVTQTMFRRILIYALGAVFLTAGGVRAQQPEVEARIAGLEGNAEYMSLLREDAQLQIREDSIVNAVERMRQNCNPRGRASTSFRIVDPVVVRPETLSNQALTSENSPPQIR